MTGLEGLIAIACFALMPVALVFISRYFNLRERQLQRAESLDPAKLQELLTARLELGARVENLEAIVCSADFEVNRRLHALAVRPAPAAPLLAARPVEKIAMPLVRARSSATRGRSTGLLESHGLALAPIRRLRGRGNRRSA